jgi:hypothetical protein
MKCPRCQHDNREGRRFCAECGASLPLACRACGFSNEPGEKFCGGCGAPLGSPAGAATDSRFSSPESYTPRHLAERILTSKTALEGERKQVTVLFADLKGSMELLADREAYEGFSLDGGDTWGLLTDGMHAHYARRRRLGRYGAGVSRLGVRWHRVHVSAASVLGDRRSLNYAWAQVSG